MKKRSARENRKLVQLAVALSSAALLFLSVAGVSTPAVAGQDFAQNDKTIRQTEAVTASKADNEAKQDRQPVLRLSLSDQGTSPEQQADSLPEPPVQTAPSGRRSVNTDPTTPATTSAPLPTETPASTQPETITQTTETNVAAPPVTKPSPTATLVPETTTTTSQAPPSITEGYFNRASCDEFISLLNQYRTANGKTALKKSSQLTSIAESRAVEIVADFSHAGIAKYGNYGENIFMGSGLPKYDLASTALQAFKNSPGHDYNQLYDKYKSIGVGHYVTASGAHYWAVVFSF